MNNSSHADTAPRTAPWKWGICWLMFLATMLNYMDRQALGNTSPFLMREFDRNEEGYGRVEKSFGYTHAVSQLPIENLPIAFLDHVSINFVVKTTYTRPPLSLSVAPKPTDQSK